MKKIVRITVKVILAIIFLYNIGLFSFISKLPKERQAPEKLDRGKENNEYLNKKIENATNLGGDYGPEEYFSDLTEINLKEKSNDFDRYAVIYVNYTTNILLAKFNENVTRHRKLDSKVENDNFMKRLSAAQQKCLNIIDPEAQKRSIEFETKSVSLSFWVEILLGFLSWFLKCYWLNFPLALILLWLWWYEDKNKLSISNPLSFLICLILYPIIIVRVWVLSIRNGARMFAMNVDFRRRQVNIFSLISSDELADIKRFAKSDLKISDYKKYLDNRSLVYRHALVPIAMVTFILLIVPRFASAEVKHRVVNASECQLNLKAPPNLSSADASHHEKISLSAVMPSSPVPMFNLILVLRLVLPLSSKRCQGFQTNPDPIPLVA